MFKEYFWTLRISQNMKDSKKRIADIRNYKLLINNNNNNNNNNNVIYTGRVKIISPLSKQFEIF